jgi:rhomboid family GlyGly-CTERM serine protease
VTAPGQAWLALAALLAAGSVLAWWAPAWVLDWQPRLAWSEPWRAFTAACVHWSPLHLGANLGATAAVAAFGWAAKLPPRAALAWGVAWPLTHVGLLLRPELAHYGGLSGMLHGGVAVVVLWLLVLERGRRRAIGALVAVGLVAKLWLEQPWGPALRQAADWDIALAPLSHATGAVAGLLCGGLALVLGGATRRPGRGASRA